MFCFVDDRFYMLLPTSNGFGVNGNLIRVRRYFEDYYKSPNSILTDYNASMEEQFVREVNLGQLRENIIFSFDGDFAVLPDTSNSKILLLKSLSHPIFTAIKDE